METEKFTTSEHMAGFHDKVQEGCYECARENRLIQAKKVVMGNNIIDFLGGGWRKELGHE